MDLKPEEIDTIKTVGSLNGDEVKLIRLKGGLHIAVGKGNKKDKENKPLAVASHPGIILHQIEKEFKTDFHRTMAKSEAEDLGNLTSFSHIVPDDKSNKGYDMFSLEKNGIVEYTVTKFNINVANLSLYKNSEEILSVSCKDKNMVKEFSEWIAKAIKNG